MHLKTKIEEGEGEVIVKMYLRAQQRNLSFIEVKKSPEVANMGKLMAYLDPPYSITYSVLMSRGHLCAVKTLL